MLTARLLARALGSGGRLVTLLATSLTVTLLAGCGEDALMGAPPAPPPPPVVPVASVRLSHEALDLAVGEPAALRAEALDATGKPLAGRVIGWRTSDPSVAAVDAQGTLAAVGVGVARVTAESDGKSASVTVRVSSVDFDGLAGRWRVVHVDGRPVPTVVRTFRDAIVDSTRFVALVEIRLDSARKDVLPDGRYQQRFCFSELHDGVVRLRECWGDHGRVTLAHAPAQRFSRVRFESQYLQGLTGEGELTLYGRLHMEEPLWHGVAPQVTAWVKE
jgi:hypothetical protein